MDPLGLSGGIDLYVYAENDPVNNTDPFGLDASGYQYCYAAVADVETLWASGGYESGTNPNLSSGAGGTSHPVHPGLRYCDTWYYTFSMCRARDPTQLEFVYLPLFERTRKGVLSEDDMHRLEDELLENPEAGDVEADTGGVRKVRARMGQRGKSGSVRVVYLYVEAKGKLYFILAFSKNVQGTLTQDQKKLIRKLAAQLKKER